MLYLKFAGILDAGIIREGDEATLEGLNKGEALKDREGRRDGTVDTGVESLGGNGLGL